jgi:hypothetical protein
MEDAGTPSTTASPCRRGASLPVFRHGYISIDRFAGSAVGCSLQQSEVAAIDQLYSSGCSRMDRAAFHGSIKMESSPSMRRIRRPRHALPEAVLPKALLYSNAYIAPPS